MSYVAILLYSKMERRDHKSRVNMNFDDMTDPRSSLDHWQNFKNQLSSLEPNWFAHDEMVLFGAMYGIYREMWLLASHLSQLSKNAELNTIKKMEITYYMD